MKLNWLVTIGACVLAVGMGAGLVGLSSSGCVFYLNPQCNDQIRNGNETGVDCGGGTCGPCDIGESCNADSDCDKFDAICRGGTCTPTDCTNGIKGQQETDVDCGGPMCSKCSGGRACLVDSDCFSGTCVPATNTCFELANVSFDPAQPYASGTKTYTIFSGDLDGDGDIDIAAANEEDSTITVFLNDGHGNFTRVNGPHGGAFSTDQIQNPMGGDLSGEYPTGGAVVDVNHDGRLDIVTANYHGDSIGVLINTGTTDASMFATAVNYPTVGPSANNSTGGETSNLAVGDLDGDGNIDVIAVNPHDGSFSRFMGRADGTFAPAVTEAIGVKSGSTGPFSVAIADFNGDKKLDMATADIATGPVIVRLGNGDGTFGPENPYPANFSIAGAAVIFAADLNLDGKIDLVTANREDSSVSVFLGHGDGTFRKPIVSSTRTNGQSNKPYSIAVADFNGDKVPDLAMTCYDSAALVILLGIGNGHFETSLNVGIAASLPGDLTTPISYGTTSGDFNGDGKPDVATANALLSDISVKLNTSH